MLLYNLVWSYRVLYERVWSCMVLQAIIWSSLVLYGSVWSSPILYGLLYSSSWSWTCTLLYGLLSSCKDLNWTVLYSLVLSCVWTCLVCTSLYCLVWFFLIYHVFYCHIWSFTALYGRLCGVQFGFVRLCISFTVLYIILHCPVWSNLYVSYSSTWCCKLCISMFLHDLALLCKCMVQHGPHWQLCPICACLTLGSAISFSPHRSFCGLLSSWASMFLKNFHLSQNLVPINICLVLCECILFGKWDNYLTLKKRILLAVCLLNLHEQEIKRNEQAVD